MFIGERMKTVWEKMTREPPPLSGNIDVPLVVKSQIIHRYDVMNSICHADSSTR